MATPPRPERTACTDSTAERSESTECTHWAPDPVHDSVHDQQGSHSRDVTLSERATVTVRARPCHLPAAATGQNRLGASPTGL
jgi:hypothetical protein